jgi:hypothetical protein
VEQLVKEKFEKDEAPTGVVIDVGDKPTFVLPIHDLSYILILAIRWKSPDNYYRKEYGIDCRFLHSFYDVRYAD